MGSSGISWGPGRAGAPRIIADPPSWCLTLTRMRLPMRVSGSRPRSRRLTLAGVGAVLLPMLIAAPATHSGAVLTADPHRESRRWAAHGRRREPGGAGSSRPRTRARATIANPFMDPERPLFAKAESLGSVADGRVIVERPRRLRQGGASNHHGLLADRTRWSGHAAGGAQLRPGGRPRVQRAVRAVERGAGALLGRVRRPAAVRGRGIESRRSPATATWCARRGRRRRMFRAAAHAGPGGQHDGARFSSAGRPVEDTTAISGWPIRAAAPSPGSIAMVA